MYKNSAAKDCIFVLSALIKTINISRNCLLLFFITVSTNNQKPIPQQAGNGRKGAFMSQNNISKDEKKILQAKHRVEEAEARNRVKEQKARTHRLIQEGALLESIAPSVREMSMEQLKRELMICLRGFS